MSVLIKRYANRKLYNTDTSRYITLKGIAELLDAGQEVQVIDNETGEDITHVALSQILVDSKRSHTSPPHTLLSQILGRGGDALYGALRKSVDEATDGLGEFQDRVRRMVSPDEEEGDDPARDPSESQGGRNQRSGAAAEFEQLIHSAMERVFRVLDLPRRSDIEALNARLDRVAAAVETLERTFTPAPADPATAEPENDPEGAH
jgi:polyhydroxyalkanoate synthesis repressor PhaR